MSSKRRRNTRDAGSRTRDATTTRTRRDKQIHDAEDAKTTRTQQKPLLSWDVRTPRGARAANTVHHGASACCKMQHAAARLPHKFVGTICR